MKLYAISYLAFHVAGILQLFIVCEIMTHVKILLQAAEYQSTRLVY